MADSLIPENNQNSNPNEREEILVKWKDKPPEEILNAKVESDLYIKSLTARLDDLSKDYLRLREDHQASTDLKTLIDQMKKSQSPDNNVVTPQTENQTAIKPEEIQSLVEKQVSEKLTQHQTLQKQQENFRMVQEKLKQVFGDNYVNAYRSRLDQLGLTTEYADDLAKNHPSVFMKTFDLENRQVSPAPGLPRNERLSSFTPNAHKRDWSYYQELKKNNPRLYLDPKIAIQMHNDAVELGDAFGMPD